MEPDQYDLEEMVLNFPAWYGGLDDQTRERLDDHFSAFPETERRAQERLMVMRYAASRATGLNPVDVEENWSIVRGGLADRGGDDWLEAGDSDDAFYAKTHAFFQQQRDERRALFGADDAKAPDADPLWQKSLVNQVREAASRREHYVPIVAKWQAEMMGQPGYDPRRAAYYIDVAQRAHGQMTALMDKVEPIANQAYDLIAKYRSGEDGGDEAPAYKLRGLKPEEKHLVFNLMKKRAGKLGIKQGEDWLEAHAFGEGVWRSFENFFQGGNVGRDRSRLLNSLRKEGEIVNGRRLTQKEADRLNRPTLESLDDLDTGEILRKIGTENIDPTRVGTQFFQDFVLPIADSTAVMTSLAIPGGGILTYEQSLRAYQNDEYLRLVNEEGMDVQQANEIAFRTGAIQAGIERIPVGKAFSGMAKKVMPVNRMARRFAMNNNQFVRAGTAVGKEWMGQTVEEVVQDQVVPALVLDFSTDDAKYDIENGDRLMKIAESVPGNAAGTAILSTFFGLRKTRRQSLDLSKLSTSPTLMSAAGYSLEQIREIETAAPEQRGQLLADYLPLDTPKGEHLERLTKELPELYANEQAVFEQRSKAEAGATVEAADYAIRVTRDQQGWKVGQRDGAEVVVESVEAARRIREDLKLVGTQEEAQRLISVMDQWHNAAPEGVARESVLTGETARSEGQKISYQREGRTTREIANAQDLANLREQARMDAKITGNEDIDVAVNGANWVGKVAHSAREMIQRLEINQSPSAMMTFLHESVEADVRLGIKTGAITHAETQGAIRSIAGAFDPKLARDLEEQAFRERVQRVARGEANEIEQRETLSELAVADVLGRRRDGRTMPAGSITAALDAALVNASNPTQIRELGKVRAFLRTVRNYFRATFGTMAALKKARRDGGAQEFDALVNKLFGENWEAAREWTDRKGLERAVSNEKTGRDAGAAFSVRRRKFLPGMYPESLRETIVSTNAKTLENHPRFHEAREQGNPDAAEEVVHDVLKDAAVDKLRSIIAGRNVIYVPVTRRATGLRANALPVAYAWGLHARLGGEVDEEIVQTSGKRNRNATVKERFANERQFEGPVKEGALYVVVDDTHTSGDTLASLIDHIQSNGGQVIAASSLARSLSQNYLKPRPRDVAKLLDDTGLNEESFQREFGVSIQALTGSEIYRLNLHPRSWDAARVRADVRSRMAESGSPEDRRGSEGSDGPARGEGSGSEGKTGSPGQGEVDPGRGEAGATETTDAAAPGDGKGSEADGDGKGGAAVAESAPGETSRASREPDAGEQSASRASESAEANVSLERSAEAEGESSPPSPRGTWETESDAPGSVPVFKWTRPPRSAADLSEALLAEDARTRARRTELLVKIRKLQGRHRPLAKIHEENALLTELAELDRTRIQRARAIVRVHGHVIFAPTQPPPPHLEALFDQGAAIVTAYTDPRLLPEVEVVELPEDRDRPLHKGGKIYYRPEHLSAKVAHEITHATEQQNDHVLQATLAFLKRRTFGEIPRKLSELTGESEYLDSEIAYEDEWKRKGGNVYTGRYYDGEYATEILTMGIERLHKDPLLFLRTDPDFFSFVVNTLRMW